MLGRLIMIVVGILSLISVGFFSYTYLDQSPESHDISEVQKSSPVSTTSAPVAPKKIATKPSPTTTTNGNLVPKTAVTEKTVVTPGPLRAVVRTSNTSDLTVSGIIAYTNKERAQNGGLPALTENALLDRDAQMKLADMFAKQYFEHESPSGVGPADLAKTVGYAYVIVGENLALGDFGSDQGVVTAWMNSPGHRANILNTHYQEIGVAVGKGMYEGSETWLAVQSFGAPLSACPAIDYALKSQIDGNNVKIAALRTELDAKKALIDTTPPSEYNYNVYVSEYNALIPEYNVLVGNNRILVANYNAGVQAFNSCIGTFNTH